jgi:CrcB protein
VSAAAWPFFLLAASAGAILRHETARRLNLGILAVNVAGSLILGVLLGLARHHGLTADPYLVLGSGFCGSLTTFSTVAVDVANRPEMRWRYGLVTIALCLAAARIGLQAAGG